jgi:hypothetical protein
MQLVPAVMHVALELTSYLPQPHLQVVVATAQQAARARRWLDGTGLVTPERLFSHVVGRVRRMPERLGRELANRIDAPWALRAWLVAIHTATTVNGANLVVLVGRTDACDSGGLVWHQRFS